VLVVNVSTAALFLLALEIGLAAEELPVPDEEPVPVAPEPATPVLVEFFSMRMCGELSAVGYGEVVLVVLVGRREMVGLNLLEDAAAEAPEEDAESAVLLGVGVGVGVGVGEADGEGVGVALSLEESLEEPAAAALLAALATEPSVLKTTMLAVEPLGIVTTQKLAPPAPDAWLALVTPPMPSVDGLMEHGVPLHPPPSHSILTPNVGLVPAREDAVQIGFHPTLANVLPSESVLAPAT
jgi:hypothetical protein